VRLRRRQLGYLFHRESEIGPYIVDFMCREKKLIIEVDGALHVNSFRYDAKRTLFLEQRGFKVVRILNEEIYADNEEVIERMKIALEKSPSLLLRRGSTRRGREWLTSSSIPDTPSRSGKCFLRTAARAATRITLHAGAIAHHRVVAAFATAIAFIAFQLCFRSPVHLFHGDGFWHGDCGLDGDGG
jgi:very-short-patch-repair endonuclease